MCCSPHRFEDRAATVSHPGLVNFNLIPHGKECFILQLCFGKRSDIVDINVFQRATVCIPYSYHFLFIFFIYFFWV